MELTVTGRDAIYADYNATTPVRKEVVDVILPFLNTHYGNPSSSHRRGTQARDSIEDARKHVANLLGAEKMDEIVFCSGGTESINMGIIGAMLRYSGKGCRIICSAVEHVAVLKTCEYLVQSHGFELMLAPVDKLGKVLVSEFKQLLSRNTVLVSIMLANNEVGALQPVKEISQMINQLDWPIIIHTDASQGAGKIPIDVNDLGVDLLSIAGHKLYAPKGVGALYIRSGIQVEPIMFGAGHEFGRRPGTENVPYIVGLGEACRLAKLELSHNFDFLSSKRSDLLNAIVDSIPLESFRVNTDFSDSLPNTLSISFKNVSGVSLVDSLKESVAVSSGSACHAGSNQASYVLTAMGVPLLFALGTIRISLGIMTTDSEIEQISRYIIDAVLLNI